MANISIENKEKLSDFYYKDSNYFGRDKLYTLAQSKDINVSRRQVMTWLKDQEIYQRYKKADKAKTIKPTILKEPFKQLGIDLIDMQGKEYKQNRYILTCIDLFSKYAWAEPIKTNLGAVELPLKLKVANWLLSPNSDKKIVPKLRNNNCQSIFFKRSLPTIN